MFYNNFCTITSLILTFFLYNFQLWWCCASNNLREDHWWSLLHMRGGDNVTSDSNHAGQESHCQKIAFAWTSNAFSISFPESVWMKGATQKGTGTTRKRKGKPQRWSIRSDPPYAWSFWSVVQGAPMQLQGPNCGAVECNDGELGLQWWRVVWIRWCHD